jgi:hemoglobin
MTPNIPGTSLYERLGGAKGVAAISDAVVEAHKRNPIIHTRFLASDATKLKSLVSQFFSMGSGGPPQYEGRDMRTTHRGMNLTERELVAAIDDILHVLEAQGIDPATRGEVLAIVYSLKDEVLYQ